MGPISQLTWSQAPFKVLWPDLWLGCLGSLQLMCRLDHGLDGIIADSSLWRSRHTLPSSIQPPEFSCVFI